MTSTVDDSVVWGLCVCVCVDLSLERDIDKSRNVILDALPFM